MKKIMLLGDSIRLHYDAYVENAFRNSAETYYPEGNCAFSQVLLRYLGEWLKQSGFQENTDCVHWNAGLWDTIVMYQDGCMTPLSAYQYFIEHICERICRLCPKAKVIFATTVPSKEAWFPEPEVRMRYNRDIEIYNQTAVEIVSRYGFAVNDLYSLLKDAPDSLYSDDTHLHTREGMKLISGQVIDCISKAIDIPADPVEYEKIFEAEGI